MKRGEDRGEGGAGVRGWQAEGTGDVAAGVGRGERERKGKEWAARTVFLRFWGEPGSPQNH